MTTEPTDALPNVPPSDGEIGVEIVFLEIDPDVWSRTVNESMERHEAGA